MYSSSLRFNKLFLFSFFKKKKSYLDTYFLVDMFDKNINKLNKYDLSKKESDYNKINYKNRTIKPDLAKELF
jgi:hypothetical protein